MFKAKIHLDVFIPYTKFISYSTSLDLMDQEVHVFISVRGEDGKSNLSTFSIGWLLDEAVSCLSLTQTMHQST